MPVTVIDGQQTNAALTVDAPSLKVLAREDETPQVTLESPVKGTGASKSGSVCRVASI